MLSDRSVRSLMTCRRGNVERCWAYLINSPRRWHMHKSRLTVEVEELSCLLVDHVSLIRPLDATTLSRAEKERGYFSRSVSDFNTTAACRANELLSTVRARLRVDILHNTDRVLLLLPHEKSSRDHWTDSLDLKIYSFIWVLISNFRYRRMHCCALKRP